MNTNHKYLIKATVVVFIELVTPHSRACASSHSHSSSGQLGCCSDQAPGMATCTLQKGNWIEQFAA